MKASHLILVVLLALASSGVLADDPHPLHDFCAAINDTTKCTSDHNYHFIHASFFHTASTCNPSAQDSYQEGFLKVVHNHGPCSSHKQAASLAEILERDHARLTSKHSKFPGVNLNRKYIRGDYSKAVTIGAKTQDADNTHNTLDFYDVDLYVGTPKKKLTLVMDTGSNIFWTQCQPCSGGCYKQRNPIFNPFKSSTYTNITCGTPTCDKLINTTGYPPQCVSKTCVFQVNYGSGSTGAGFLAKESVSLTSTPTDNINDFVFGCRVQNKDSTLGVVDGILGLGPDPLSIVQQTVKKYQRVFSYCLPTKPSETGFLRFGKSKPVSKSLKFTQLRETVAPLQYYVIDLVGVKLADKKLPITLQKNAVIIDSGTVVSRLPEKHYKTLRDAYREVMSHYNLVNPEEFSPFDTCYQVNEHEKLKIPRMSFLFANGIAVDIHPNGIAIPVNSSLYCFPFLPATAQGLENMMIFGAAQQQSLEVVYDVAGGKIGFGNGGCK